jgi:xeroderma pigmentosum group C-complementing protein
VPPFAKQLPAGTTHLDLPCALAACKALGIDFAPALVGFEPSRGGMLPRIQGVVVCIEHAEAVQTFAAEVEADRQERARQRRYGSTCRQLTQERFVHT